jgi:hypothetical protein
MFRISEGFLLRGIIYYDEDSIHNVIYANKSSGDRYIYGCYRVKKEEYSRERKIALESGNNNLNFK